ncbi:surface protease GP63 [Trypanosoma theileri]|uniref:Leishmanolysin-like peptidase n=1 Tax=Trypanosoma theileri TaxID=67003 RepID=A0A1X0NF66_9TRYP|nr:surface protease GP63 [Trypanosoma theileri]ORC81334.1 surface protease GP63 [Trypanosoma theileri]
MNSSETLEILKRLYECKDGEKNELKGLYFENEQNNGLPPHWERRIAKDELMSTYSDTFGTTGMYYTALTLAAFHSMPFYSANFSMAEPMSWGKQYICDLFKGKKDLTQTHYPDMFCKDDTMTLRCTSDRFALGICSTDAKRNNLRGRYQYIKDEYRQNDANDLMDGVPFIRPLNGTACEGGEEELMPGNLVSSMSRCLDLETPILKDNKDDVKVQAVCAKVKCDNDNKKVSVQLKGHDNKELNWYKCENDGESIPLEDSLFNKGSVKCPNFKEVCTGLPKTEPTKIKFYNGTKITESYVDVKDDDENEEPAQAQNTVRTAGASAVANQGSSAPDARPSAQPEGQQHPNPQQEVQEVEKEIKSQTLSLKHPESENAEHTGSSSVTPGSNTGSGGNNNDNGSNEDQNMGQARESASTRVDVPSGQSLSSPPAAAGSATIDPANTVTREISQQPADQPAQNNDKQNENETPAEAQDHQQVPNQTENKVQSPTKANAQTDDSTDVQNNTHGEESTQRNRHDTATTFSSAANSNGIESTIQSPHTANNGVLNGTNLTEDQIKEETLKHTNVTGMLGPDSSIMVSYMAPLALLVCVVGFMMVP